MVLQNLQKSRYFFSEKPRHRNDHLKLLFQKIIYNIRPYENYYSQIGAENDVALFSDFRPYSTTIVILSESGLKL